MILRIVVENFPEIDPPNVPAKDAEPMRAASFCVNPANFGREGVAQVLCAHFLECVKQAILGKPPESRIIVPGDGEGLPE